MDLTLPLVGLVIGLLFAVSHMAGTNRDLRETIRRRDMAERRFRSVAFPRVYSDSRPLN